MGKERFHGESAANLEDKCLCVILIDVSGTMEDYMPELNAALKGFFLDITCGRGVPEGTKDQLEVCVEIFDEDVKFLRNPCLLDIGEVPAELSTRNSTTESVKALRAALKMIDDRKEFYMETGQSYYRPWLVFLTDGEPNPYRKEEISEFAKEIKELVKLNKVQIIGLGVGEQISMETLSKLTAGNARLLKDNHFGDFFKWLSNSLAVYTHSHGTVNPINPSDENWMNSVHM